MLHARHAGGWQEVHHLAHGPLDDRRALGQLRQRQRQRVQARHPFHAGRQGRRAVIRSAPAAAPMLSVPTAPAFAAITTGPSPLTTPLSAIVSVPVPELPMFSPKVLLQAEPAPVTVAKPCEPAPLPMLATVPMVALVTFPPFAIVSVPLPKLPILSPPLGPLLQLEPAPVTVTVPVEPTDNPTEPPPLQRPLRPTHRTSLPQPTKRADNPAGGPAKLRGAGSIPTSRMT